MKPSNFCSGNSSSWIELTVFSGDCATSGQFPYMTERYVSEQPVAAVYPQLEQLIDSARKIEAARHALVQRQLEKRWVSEVARPDADSNSQRSAKPAVDSAQIDSAQIDSAQIDIAQINDSAFLVDVETQRLSKTNTAFRELLGYSSDEAKRLDIHQVLVCDRDRIRQQLQHVLLEEHQILTRQQYRHKNGSVRDVEVQICLINQDQRPALCVAARDADEREQAERHLAACEAEFYALAESMSSVVFICQSEQLRYISPSIETVSGYTQEEVLTMNIWDLIDPRELAQLRRLKRQQQKPVLLRYTLDLLTKQEEERCLEIVTTSIQYDGRCAMIGIASDVTAPVKRLLEIKES